MRSPVSAIAGILLWCCAQQASAASVPADFSNVTVGGASDPWDYSVDVGSLGSLFFTYDSLGGRNDFNADGSAFSDIPGPSFGLGAGGTLTVSSNFSSPLKFTIWDLDTVSTSTGTETLTLSNSSETVGPISGVANNIFNPDSATDPNPIYATLAIAFNDPIVLQAGPDGAAFVVGAVSAVPLPAAAWLFGSALIGFMTLANRRAA
jgi:hypothetical protein